MSERPRERPAKRTRSRETILDAAARLFRERGLTETSLREIAAAAGMQAASLYCHFSSKDELATEVLGRGVDAVHEEVRHALEDLPTDASVEERVRVAAEAHLRSLLLRSDYTSAHSGASPPSCATAGLKPAGGILPTGAAPSTPGSRRRGPAAPR